MPTPLDFGVIKLPAHHHLDHLAMMMRTLRCEYDPRIVDSKFYHDQPEGTIVVAYYQRATGGATTYLVAVPNPAPPAPPEEEGGRTKLYIISTYTHPLLLRAMPTSETLRWYGGKEARLYEIDVKDVTP